MPPSKQGAEEKGFKFPLEMGRELGRGEGTESHLNGFGASKKV